MSRSPQRLRVLLEVHGWDPDVDDPIEIAEYLIGASPTEIVDAEWMGEK